MLKKANEPSPHGVDPIKGMEDRFELKNGRLPMGHGQFGVVYVVKRISDGTKFALKQVDVSDRAIQQMFLSETATMSKLKHENVVCLEESWMNPVDGGRLYGLMLLEWCESDIGKIWKEMKRSSSVQKGTNPFLDKNDDGLVILEDYLIQGLKGLVYIHSNQVVHCDIKPDNLFLKMVAGREVLKFGDFGMSKFVFGSQMLASRLVGGSQAYQPPELRREGAKPGPSTDIYSLGVTIWQLATFDTPDPSVLIRLEAGYANKRITSAVNAMLSNNPESRPSAAQSLRSLKVKYCTAQRKRVCINVLGSGVCSAISF
jgi:serine/threonine protein kinase